MARSKLHAGHPTGEPCFEGDATLQQLQEKRPRPQQGVPFNSACSCQERVSPTASEGSRITHHKTTPSHLSNTHSWTSKIDVTSLALQSSSLFVRFSWRSCLMMSMLRPLTG